MSPNQADFTPTVTDICDRCIGLPQREAEAFIRRNGFVPRVLDEAGHWTMELDFNRITLTLHKGHVVEAEIG